MEKPTQAMTLIDEALAGDDPLRIATTCVIHYPAVREYARSLQAERDEAQRQVAALRTCLGNLADDLEGLARRRSDPAFGRLYEQCAITLVDAPAAEAHYEQRIRADERAKVLQEQEAIAAGDLHRCGPCGSLSLTIHYDADGERLCPQCWAAMKQAEETPDA